MHSRKKEAKRRSKRKFSISGNKKEHKKQIAQVKTSMSATGYYTFPSEGIQIQNMHFVMQVVPFYYIIQVYISIVILHNSVKKMHGAMLMLKKAAVC